MAKLFNTEIYGNLRMLPYTSDTETDEAQNIIFKCTDNSELIKILPNYKFTDSGKVITGLSIIVGRSYLTLKSDDTYTTSTNPIYEFYYGTLSTPGDLSSSNDALIKYDSSNNRLVVNGNVSILSSTNEYSPVYDNDVITKQYFENQFGTKKLSEDTSAKMSASSVFSYDSSTGTLNIFPKS